MNDDYIIMVLAPTGEGLLNFKVAWWNCRLSPPSTKAAKFKPNDGFLLTMKTLLVDNEVDILGLCEVDEDNIKFIAELLTEWGLSQYTVINMYKKEKNRIDDFCLIHNSKKIVFSEIAPSANTRTLKDEWLKAGVLAKFILAEEHTLYVALSHWQGRGNFTVDTVVRTRLGDALRKSVDEVIELHGDKVLVVMCGDYNDEPFDKSIEDALCASRDIAFVRKRPRFFFNPFWACLGIINHGEPVLNTGTCMYNGNSATSMSRTFDQIIFSSAFVNGWMFQGAGAEILNNLPVSQLGMV